MKRTNVNPGTVLLAGDCHRIALKSGGQGDIVALGLYMNAVLSPHGRGSLCVMLGEPDAKGDWPCRANIFLTDNLALAGWMTATFLRSMESFKELPALADPRWRHLDSREVRSQTTTDRFNVILHTHDVRVDMVWNDLETPLPVEADIGHSPTCRHVMYGVYQNAGNAGLAINNSWVEGKVGREQQYDRMMSSATLGMSTSWIRPARGSS